MRMPLAAASVSSERVSVAADSLNDLPENREEGLMNDALAAAPRRYALSFTTGALLVA